jgi:very-short-patch-repair endonuclease
MQKIKILPYNPRLKTLARLLRSNSTLSEVLLWQNIKGKSYGYEFHRQVPIDEFIVDFYCHELKLAIEIDGNTHDYNFDNDEKRQEKMESLGNTFIRFRDIDVKRNINDVLRALEITISDIEKNMSR